MTKARSRLRLEWKLALHFKERMKRAMFNSWVANGGAVGDFEAAWPELKAERLKKLTLKNETEARELQWASGVSRI